MVLYLKSVVEKIVESGINVTLVPVLDLGAVPIFFKVVTGLATIFKTLLVNCTITGNFNFQPA